MPQLNILLLLLAVFAAPPVQSAEWVEEPRRILALYTQDEIFEKDKDFFFHWIHEHMELPLNHLGLDVEYVDADQILPDLTKRKDVRGIIIWSGSQVTYRRPEQICKWLKTAMHTGKKIVLTGDFGFYRGKGKALTIPAECRLLFKKFGFQHRGLISVDPLMVAIGAADKSVLGFERTLDPSEEGVVPLVQLEKSARSLLRLDLTESEIPRTDPVAITPHGGFAFHPFFFYQNGDTEPRQLRWIVNPFAFFEKAFAVQGLPRPDVTTINGRRIFFSHIDGDGFFNRSEIDTTKLSAEIFLREVIKKFTYTPITIGLIAGYFDLTLFGTESAIALSRSILLQPNVEASVHGYSHPLNWRKGEVALKIPRYKMEHGREVLSSGRIIEQKVLQGRSKIRLFQWTGDCLPFAKTVEMATRAGLLNINGGGGRFDKDYPSYAYLHPIGRNLGGARQIYAPALNENIYTEEWTQRFYGYRDVIETFENTGSPLRVKPVNVYVHFYSAERYAALRALQQVYEWAISKPLIPIFTTRWVETANAFFEMKISRMGKNRFRLEGAPQMRTVRFDGEPRDPDIKRSTGVLGFKRELGSLYVSLDESASREIVFSKNARPAVWLEEANFEITRWREAGSGVHFEMQGLGGAQFTMRGLVPGETYRVLGPGFDQRLDADAKGTLRVRVANRRTGLISGEVRVEAAG